MFRFSTKLQYRIVNKKRMQTKIVGAFKREVSQSAMRLRGMTKATKKLLRMVKKCLKKRTRNLAIIMLYRRQM